MPGILDSLTSILNNPAVEEVLPAVAGAAGGMLTGRRHDFANQLGRGLEGGVGGLEQGAQLVNQQQKAKDQELYHQTMTNHLGVQDQLLQGKLDAQKVQQQGVERYNQLPEATKAQYPTYDIWSKAMAHTAITNADVPAKQQAMAQMLQSPAGRDYLASRGIMSVKDIPTSAAALDDALKGFHYEPPDVAAERAAQTERAKAGIAESGAHIAGIGIENALHAAELKDLPSVEAARTASTERSKAETAAAEETLKAKPAEQHLKNVEEVQKIKAQYDKDHPVANIASRSADANRRAAVLAAGFDPDTALPVKSIGDARGLPDGQHKDKNGKVILVVDGKAYEY